MATGKPVIVVLTGGSALAVPWLAAHAAARALRLVPGRRRGHTPSPTSCSATSTRPAASRSRSTGRPPTCRRSPTTPCAGAPTATSNGEPLYRVRRRPLVHDLPLLRDRGAVDERHAAVAVESRTPARATATRWSRSTSSRADAPPYAPRRWLAGFRACAGAGRAPHRLMIPLAPNALTLVDEHGARQPLHGELRRRDRRPAARPGGPLLGRRRGPRGLAPPR